MSRRSGEEMENRKRKRGDGELIRPTSPESTHDKILQFESRIQESRHHYNEIVKLLEYIQIEHVETDEDILAAVALCRVFCRLMAAKSMSKSRETSEKETVVIQWLRERYQDYKKKLLALLKSNDANKSTSALTLLMRLVKEEALHFFVLDGTVWRNGTFPSILQALVDGSMIEDTRTDFIVKYLKKFDDIRYYALAQISDIASSDASETSFENMVSIAASFEKAPETREDIRDFYVSSPIKKTHLLYSPIAHKKQAQETWMAILRRDLAKSQRKAVLELISHQIAPWFLKVELLLDFLTDSFNMGGSTSLMALSGLFYLIQNKNLDYPQFYPKLYSMLDSNILHSKHRSRFFRLLNIFLASTHLPAALVASFIKRLSRLTLYAPPSGIIVVVPWIYNLLKNHPTCTFMIHRESKQKNEAVYLTDEGWGDPFRVEEPDPMETDAVESSLWEIHMLQSHYHPNVATIAKIISEQFTKQAYNLEDFLDHSYENMLDAELRKDIKKPPEIEYTIPKNIFIRHDVYSEGQDSLLLKLWSFE